MAVSGACPAGRAEGAAGRHRAEMTNITCYGLGVALRGQKRVVLARIVRPYRIEFFG